MFCMNLAHGGIFLHTLENSFDRSHLGNLQVLKALAEAAWQKQDVHPAFRWTK